jgi:hypothetical protein
LHHARVGGMSAGPRLAIIALYLPLAGFHPQRYAGPAASQWHRPSADQAGHTESE